MEYCRITPGYSSWIVILCAVFICQLFCYSSEAKGLPSPPRKLYATSIEWDKIVHWTASNSTGGLPVSYQVEISCQSDQSLWALDCEEFAGAPHTVGGCESFSHSKGMQYTCDLEQADLYSWHNACVYAINQLGNSSACIRFRRADSDDPSETTSGPPLNFIAEEETQGVVKLSWHARQSWKTESSAFITIYYSKSGDKTNETLQSIPATELVKTIPNLHADCTYMFYGVAQYVTGNLSSSVSLPAVASLHTRNAAPDQAPQHVRCNASNIVDSNGKRNITLSWEPPQEKHQNGPLSKYLISVSYNEKFFNQTTVKAPKTTVVLPDFDVNKDVSLGVRACTEFEGDLCGGVSQTCTVTGVIKEMGKEETLSKATVIGVVLAGVLVFLMLLGVLWMYMYYNSSKKPRSDSLSSLPSIPPGGYVDHYQDPVQLPSDDHSTIYATAYIPTNMESPLIPPALI